MPLLFSSLFTSGAGGAPPAPPEDPFIWNTNLLFRFSGGSEVWSDVGGTVLAADDEPVARWGNLGSGADAVQSESARRPTYKTGGLNGRPYLQCAAASAQFFEDLAFSQPSGGSAINPFTVFVVTDSVSSLADFPAILGASAVNGGKVALYFRDTADAQIHWIKSQVRFGNVASPQIVMGAMGRNAAGTTSTAYTRMWLRQNRSNIFAATSQISSLPTDAVSATQFLRSSGIASGGYFDGRIYEFLLYEGTLNDATTFAIEDWLAVRYGIA
jgi:hypothetical protein